jgi:hypothetical protein
MNKGQNEGERDRRKIAVGKRNHEELSVIPHTKHVLSIILPFIRVSRECIFGSKKLDIGLKICPTISVMYFLPSLTSRPARIS